MSDDDEPITADDIVGDNDWHGWDEDVVLVDDTTSQYTRAVIDSEAKPYFQLDASNDIRFTVADGTVIIKLCADGEIQVRGKTVTDDRKVVQAMKEFLAGLNPHYKDEKENTIFPTRMCFNVERFGTRRNGRKSK